MTAKALSYLLKEGRISVDSLCTFLQSRNLTYLLPEVLRELKQSQTDSLRKDEIIIETPYELDKDALASIVDIVGAEKGGMTRMIISKDLLMGFRAEYRGYLYDASAQRIIRELTK